MPHTASLPSSFDPALAPGAANAINVCLRLRSYERLTLVTDQAGTEIAAALVAAIEKTGAAYTVFVLEEFGSRPLAQMPPEILHELAQSQASLFAGTTTPGELSARRQMIEVVTTHRLRHAHLPNVTARVFTEGMSADFRAVDQLCDRLIARCRQAKRLTARTPAGTELTVELSPDLRWVKSSGLITPARWGNLPGGEIFTAPANTHGRYVVDGVIGDPFCTRYGALAATPLTIELRDNRIASLACANRELLREFTAYCQTDENSGRVGKLALGTNLACPPATGQILQDAKAPGAHLAFGHPYGEVTGQTWRSITHLDCLGRDVDLWLDGEPLLDHGRYLL